MNEGELSVAKSKEITIRAWLDDDGRIRVRTSETLGYISPEGKTSLFEPILREIQKKKS